MTEEEFKKVKALLAEKLRKPTKPVTAAPGQATPSAETTAPQDPAS